MDCRGLGFGVSLALVVSACSGPERSYGNEGGRGGAGASGGTDGGTSSGSGGSSAEAGDTGSDAGAGAGGAPDFPEQPVSVVSVSPADGDSAKPRDAISIEFSAPVTAGAVEAWLAVANGRGAVPGSVEVSGAVATFKPKLSLCYDESYDIELTPDAAGSLSETFSSSFTIPDGSWTNAMSIGDGVPGSDYHATAIDENGNAIAVWYDDLTPVANLYDAASGEWRGPEPVEFETTAAYAAPVRALFDDAGTAYTFWPQHGMATFAPGGDPPDLVPITDLIGSTTYVGGPSLGLAPDGGAVLLWDIQSGYTPGEIFAALKAPGEPWVEPEAALATAWAIRSYVTGLPDNSFLAAYYKTPDAGTIGNIVSRRYTAAGGWSDVETLGPGTSHTMSTNRATGDTIAAWPNANGAGSAFVAIYRHASKSWGAPAEIDVEFSVGFVFPAIAADGTAFIVFGDSDTANDNYRMVARRFADGDWGDPITLREANDYVTPRSVVADDCGNALVLWKQGYELYARRFTPADGWKSPALVGQDESGNYGDPLSMNGRGEAVVVSGPGDEEFPPEDTAAARFE